MKLLVLHLSDIHIKTPEDVIIGRGPLIVAAVQNLLNPPDAIIAIISGDVAYSGNSEEYLAAWKFLDDICFQLKETANPSHGIHKVVVPGNHDCDFNTPSELRAVMLGAILKKHELALDRSIVDVCVEPQRAFFEFRDAFLDRPPNETTDLHGRLYYESTIAIGGETIVVRQLNTAWMSMIPDPQGGLLFPEVTLPSKHSASELEIAVFHHPYSWLETNNARVFRSSVEACSDIIFTGHEHVSSQIELKRDRHIQATFIEGGVLQDSYDSTNSAFNVVLIDTGKHQRRVIKFRWNGELYVTSGSHDPVEQELLWEDYKVNPARIKTQFPLLCNFAELLNDLEINLTHRTKGQLKLRDIFVFPDLREIRFQKQTSKATIKGEDVAALVSEQSCILITGDDFSGKTTLAKMLFWVMHERGDVPVLLDAVRCTVFDDRVDALVERVFCEQYEPKSLEHFRQVEKSRRIIILDNLHRIPLGPEERAAFLRKLRTISFRLIAFAHELEAAVVDLSSPSTSVNLAVPFHCYELLPFGQLRRNRIVERWLLLSNKDGVSTIAFAQTLETLTDLLNSLIGKNFLPPYPVYVLAALQAAEAGTELNVGASTHGYLYEVFIKTSLARRTSPIKVNTLSAFLAQFAYELHRQNVHDLRIAEVKVFFKWFSEEFEVTRSFDAFIEDLITQHIFKQRNDRISFRHTYLFYYFTACYLRDHIHDMHSEIEALVKNLSTERAANILLFLTHLSKDPFIVEELLNAAAAQYPGLPEATLTDDVLFLNKLHKHVLELEIPEESPRKSREALLETLDAEQHTSEGVPSKQPENSALDILNRINAALKTIQILGQVLKNFPANLNKEKKTQLLLTCSGLGRRVLTDYLNLVKDNEKELLSLFVETIRRNEPSMSVFDIREQAVATIVGLSEMTVFGLVKRLSHSLGLKELMSVYERVYGPDEGPFNMLLLAAFNLDHTGEFPEKLIEDTSGSIHSNPVAYSVLRLLVFTRLLLFPAKFQVRQKMAELLKFSYKRTVTGSSQQTLIK